MYFNEFINRRRKELGMSIDELVRISGVPKGTLSKLTSGINTNPTLSTVEAICKALGCTLNDAVGVMPSARISDVEMEHIKKYRTLDQYGQDAVNAILDIECRRCAAQVDEPKMIKVKRAARNGGGIEETDMTAEEFAELLSGSEMPQDL